MKNPQIDNNLTKQIRIDAELHRLLKLKAADAGISIKALVEGYLADLLGVENHEENK
jgi:predicted HicB family RNase H-like nuclease